MVRVMRVAPALLALIAGAGPAAWAQEPAARLQACAACHGAEGKPALQGVPSLAGQPKVFLETQLVFIREGLREIPAMSGMLEGLSDQDLTAMASHFSSQSPQPVPADKDPVRYEKGRQLAQDNRCGTCHLPDYSGREQMPRLAGQREDYLLQTMQRFKNNQATGRDTLMAAALYGIPDPDLEAIAHFLSHLAP